MFYSHQLLARKAPLGQIWMAATLHSKLNRKKLSKLNIINICEQILNPSVPMALRLSGILMGGVVIVYEHKVKLLYEDVTRLMVQINEAWKVKAATDPTLLPKGKSQAKYAAITLPENREEELPEIEQTLRNPDTVTMMDFEQTSYFTMRLDNADLYDKPNAQEEPAKDLHQVDPDNITLAERFESHHTDMFNHFERFDIEGDEETQMNYTQPEDAQIPSTPVQSPPREQAHQPDEIPDRHPEDQVKQQSDEVKEAFEQRQDQQRPKPARRRTRKATSLAIDHEQTIISGDIYQSWLQSSSDIASRKRKKRKTLSVLPSMKIARMMEMPPIALLEGLFTNGNKEVHYPAPLLKLWMRNTQPPHDSPSGKTSPPFPPEPSYTSPGERMGNLEPPFEYFQGGVGSPAVGISIEKQRANLNNNKIPPEILMEDLRTNLTNMGLHPTETNGVKETDHMATPGSGDEPRSIPSSGSGHGLLSQNSVTDSSRSNKKRPHSSLKHSGNGLQPVAEENPWHDPTLNFKLTRLSELSENGFTQDNEILMETGPTQTQHPFITQPLDMMTDSIRIQLKSHFDTPGSAEAECLNELTLGMTKKQAACLFYQTCVLATRDFVKVEQELPYGNILISRGAKM
ncbi:sister chromatid cohesion 1 protein 1 isoform X1 [Solanum lycopersicum]|uniref:sister chromatid cohesion 1 protein 1 isoform X1 n=1 Tax=Solanum lycopersicum TaxID=4081 RepID=UPI0002BCAE1F|nr:sister chromatid cohesion 1 protein 1 isoform X1 [Solanum lycopersicum]